MHPIEDLSFWPDFDIAACHQSDTNTLTIELQPHSSVALCSRCQQLSPLIHNTRIRQIRDRDLLQLMPISHVSQLTGLHWHTLKTLDKRRLQASSVRSIRGDVRRLVMDEFALHKGQRYATVIMDAERTRALWVSMGKARVDIRPFFQLMGERCQQIEAVAMEMNSAFDLEVRQHCPQAEVVYDLFHVVAR